MSQSSNPYISIVSPVYYAEKIVDELVIQVSKALEKITENYEIILVDDGSQDASWEKISENASKNNRVKGIKLSRNFGQHKAITAGLVHSKGDYVVVMDCDLQDDPKYIEQLIAKSKEGFEIVYTKKESRKHSLFKNIGAACFNTIFNWLADNKNIYSSSSIGSYSLLTRKVVNAYCSINDFHRHYLLVLRWLGFEPAFLKIEHKQRLEGKSSYSLKKLIDHAIDGITSQSTKLLHLSIGLGLTFCILSIAYASLIVTQYFLHGFKEGWTSIVVLLLLSTGLILMSLGTIGIYLGKTFEQTKNKPLFIVDKSINIDKLTQAMEN